MAKSQTFSCMQGKWILQILLALVKNTILIFRKKISKYVPTLSLNIQDGQKLECVFYDTLSFANSLN